MTKISDLPKHQILSGFSAQFIHTEHTTLGFWEVEQNAVLPMHSHIHEQITQVLEGQFELTIGDKTSIYEPGFIAVIPPNVIHGGRALTKCRIFDIFSPVREDYKNR